MSDFYLSGDSISIPVKVPYRGRHLIKWVKVTKGYKSNCGYGFWVSGGKHRPPRFYKTLRLFGIKDGELRHLRNERHK